MTVIESLSREHGLFERILRRLDHAAAFDEDSARSEFQKLLLLLLPALDAHERLEDAVFGPPYSDTEDARAILSEIEAQHRKIASLRDELQDALRDADRCPIAALRALVLQVAQKLRIHFAMEENRLWPHYRDFASRSLNHGRALKAREGVKRLEEEVRKNSSLIEDYLGVAR